MLAEAEARYQREAANLQRERTRHQDALHSNSQHRRVIDDLQAQRSAQDQQVRGLEERVHRLSCALTDTVTNSVERERELAAANTGLEDQLRALRITNASLELDNNALCEHLCALAEDRDALARRCEVLEAEKERLTVKVAQLEIDAAHNVVLRSQINLLETRSTLQIAELERQGQEQQQESARQLEELQLQRQRDRDEIDKLRETSRIRLETYAEEVRLLKEKEDQQSVAHEHQMSMLKAEANEQQAIVEQRAQAWELKWMDASKEKVHKKQQHVTPAENEADQAEVESSDDDQ